jgi:hypothetical protein
MSKRIKKTLLDPITIILGKDVADIIHRFVYRAKIQEVNQEYYTYMIRPYNNSDVLQWSRNYGIFWWNWRLLGIEFISTYIYNVYSGKGIYNVPKNYNSIAELY